MKKLLFMLFVTAIVFAVGCQKEENDLTSQVSSNEEELYEEPIVPIDIDVEIIDGVLNFDDHEAIQHALSFLDTVNLASREAWEKEIGFKSIRTLIEKEIASGDIFGNQSNPTLLNQYPGMAASILNEDGLVIINGALGTMRREGSYWTYSKEKSVISQAILSGKSDTSTNTSVYLYFDPNQVEHRSCVNSGSPWFVSFESIHDGQDPNQSLDDVPNGTSRLDASFESNVIVYPDGPSFSYVNSFAKIAGRSWRKTSGSWKLNRADHSMNWNFDVWNYDSGAISNFSGSETHFNNQNVGIKFTFSDGTFPNADINEKIFLLETLDADHTTHKVSPRLVEHSCM